MPKIKAKQKKISKKISLLVNEEHKKPEQAVAIALSMERRGELNGKHK